MKVAIASYHYPSWVLGGAAIYAANLAKHLSSMVDLTLFIPAMGTPERSSAQLKLLGVSRVPHFGPIDFFRRVAQEVDKGHYDVVHSIGGSGVFVPTLTVETYFHKPLGLVEILNSIPHLICVRKAKRVIATSPSSHKDLSVLGVDMEKVRVLGLGVSEKLFYPDPQLGVSVRRQFGLGDKFVYLCVLTSLSGRKDPVFLLRAFAEVFRQVKHAHLLILCPSKGRQKVVRYAQTLGILSRVTLCYPVPYELMRTFYAASDVLVVSSAREGFGMPLLEATLCGKGFVSTDVGVARELKRLGIGSVASSGPEFVERCTEASESPPAPTDASIAYIRDNYSWRSIAQKTCAVYSKCLNSSR